MRAPAFFPLSNWRSDVLVSTGVSDRFSDTDIRAALREHGSLRDDAITRVRVGELGSIVVRSDPRSRRTLVLRPDELRLLQSQGRS